MVFAVGEFRGLTYLHGHGNGSDKEDNREAERFLEVFAEHVVKVKKCWW